MSTELVQIQSGDIPPLHQSSESVMACPLFYKTSIIDRKRQPSGMESARGTQVHATLGKYALHCSQKGIAQDLAAFDDLSKGAGPEAAKILVGLRDGYSVDHQHLLGTEVMMSLDENFQPTETSGAIEGIASDSGLPPAFQGTLDAIYMFRPELRIDIDDAKSHMRPFEPSETLQGKMYSLFVFQHFPWAMEVKFRLWFVRYKNLFREVVYTRKDVPSLIDAVHMARERQKMIHANVAEGKEIEAIPGAHCIYCPLLSNRKCPIAEYNANMQLTPVDRLKFNLWYSAFSRINNAALKDYVQGTGKKVILRDYNGKSYVYGPVPTESDVYPLFKAIDGGIAVDHQGRLVMPIVTLLEDYANASPDDTEWLGKLTISGTKLKSSLKAKARAMVDQAIKDTADKVTKVPLKVSKPLDAVEDDEPDEGESEWGDEEDF